MNTVLISFLLSLSVIGFSQHNTRQSVFQSYTDSMHFNGVVLIATSGKPIFKKAAGWANRTDSIANTEETKFKIASITKTFTAVMIMQLVEQGKIQLSDKISAHLPEYKGKGKDQIPSFTY